MPTLSKRHVRSLHISAGRAETGPNQACCRRRDERPRSEAAKDDQNGPAIIA
jgi:hypothetical protein